MFEEAVTKFPMTERTNRRENKPWARQYTPGYTGFVPAKVELFGKTAGQMNREICEAKGLFENLNNLTLTHSITVEPIP